MVDLSLDFMGLTLKNPFLIAPGVPTVGIGEIKKNAQRIAKGGWAGIVTKTILPEGRNFLIPYPYLWAPTGSQTDEKLRKITMQSDGSMMYELSEKKESAEPLFRDHVISRREIEENVQAAKNAGLVTIMSITAPTPEEWTYLAKTMEECGADGIELNLSCPVAISEKGMGSMLGQKPGPTEKSIKAAKKCNIPVTAKLTPNVTDFPMIAKVAEDAGADAITAINTVLGLVGIDVETCLPLSRSAGGGKGIFSGLSGPLLKPIGLRCVAQVANAVKIPISATGGISDWKSAVEYMMVGAKNVQMCTAVMRHGFNLARELVKDLESFMERKGYKNVEDFVGLSLPHIATCYEEMDLTSLFVSKVDETVCTGCGLCARACTDGAFDAIEVVDNVAIIDKSKCRGCGLCKIVCPVHQCISFEPKL